MSNRSWAHRVSTFRIFQPELLVTARPSLSRQTDGSFMDVNAEMEVEATVHSLMNPTPQEFVVGWCFDLGWCFEPRQSTNQQNKFLRSTSHPRMDDLARKGPVEQHSLTRMLKIIYSEKGLGPLQEAALQYGQ